MNPPSTNFTLFQGPLRYARPSLYCNIALVCAMLLVALGLIRGDNVPINVSVRPGVFDSLVLVSQFNNTSNKALFVRADFRRTGTVIHRAFTFSLPPSGLKVIGRIQGWNVKPGDQITVKAQGYTDLNWRVP